jgi:hypothetical protein
MSVKHSPTPWRLRKSTFRSGEVEFSIEGTDCETLCIFDVGERPIDAINAAHIVRCVNSHDALVGALRSVIEYLDAYGTFDTDDGAFYLNNARAALRAAMGEE